MDISNDIEIWKIRKLIKSLSKAKGNGTSMISLIIPAGAQISLTNRMLTEEYGTASNIKSRVNRLSVLSAITSAQQKLKLYSRTPKNGLVVLCGTIMTDEGKEKKLNIDFEPFKPINRSLYLCDNKFHLEPLEELLQNDETYGFVIIDGNGSLFATLSGNSKNILHSFSVDLPKKHGRGGQSALRFARLRIEARHNYMRKVSELIKKYFTKDNKPTIKGLILAGSADIKVKVTEIDTFPVVLKSKILASLDISYGGENGLQQAIGMSTDILANVKLVEDRKMIADYFYNISKDTGLFCFGVEDTKYALELGAVEKLIIWEDLPIIRYTLYNVVTEEEIILNIHPDKVTPKTFIDNKTQKKLDIKKEELFIEWMVENHKTFGVKQLCIISNKTQETAQFCNGFGGIGGILRWKVDFEVNNVNDYYQEDIQDDDNTFDYDFDDFM